MNHEETISIEQFHHRLPLQIRFSDVDVLGHVNNTVYLAFYDTGKAGYMTSVLGRKISWKEVDTVIANINCSFIAPIFFGEQIEVLTRCEGIGDKSFRLEQVIREITTGQIKSTCKTVMVCFEPKTQTSCHVSEEWRQKLTSFESK